MRRWVFFLFFFCWPCFVHFLQEDKARKYFQHLEIFQEHSPQRGEELRVRGGSAGERGGSRGRTRRHGCWLGHVPVPPCLMGAGHTGSISPPLLFPGIKDNW